MRHALLMFTPWGSLIVLARANPTAKAARELGDPFTAIGLIEIECLPQWRCHLQE